ncbi:zinc-binding dehydrogenase [Sphingomonas xinjiangensis]|uniref:NADPH2:quinone reductase n=1 Tax=Sphingomonas xinjiangensis TaxID=643568 RepID=A0A840YS30_9SPHN|nr:zinc-binding dehydrogenase [Sphingomonas xinjiangensis]MBB5712485.1 NADPH2:quinone reductase [Sphingomonas xinjiangensis]
MSKVVRFRQTGAPAVMVVEEDVVGPPGRGEVQLRQHAIGVNFVDTAFRDGSFGTPLPAVAGIEAAGVVTALGEGVTSFTPGDRVSYFFAPGSYAEVRNVSAEALIPLPEDISFETAAAIMAKGLTARMGVRRLHAVQPGQTVIVQGATGGVGSFTARWSAALGAKVIGTGSRQKLDLLEGSGVIAVDSHDHDLGAALRRIAPDGADVVYEFVGKATFPASITAVRDGGTIVAIGAASGAPDADADLLASRAINLTRGSTAQLVRGPLLQSASLEVFDALRRGYLGTPKLHRYRLEDAVQAHIDIATRARDGLPILLP